MKLFFIRYIKITFLYLQLHRIFAPFTGIFSNLYYLTKFSKWAHKHRNIKPNDFPSKWDYNKRYDLYKWVLNNEGLIDIKINYLEFGVASGQSFQWFLKQNTNGQSSFTGFDTFTGLPEDFGVYKKGMFNTNNQVPQTNDKRGQFQQGLFQQTLPGFLKSFNNDKRKVIMLDADLYSATLFVLSSIAPFLNKNDIIFFDEFSVPTHEFKAFTEFQEAFPHIQIELIAAANNYYFSAFKVL